MSKNLAEEMQRTARQALAGMQPVGQGEEAGGLPFWRLIAATFRSRYLLFGTTLFGILVGTFLAITTPNVYVSTGKFLFTSSGAEATMMDPSRARETSQETIATGAAYILNTDEPLRRVVTALGPNRILQPYQPGTPDDSGAKALFFRIQRDWNATKETDRTPEGALRQLKRTVTVERPPYTDVLLVECRANDPVLAQAINATFMTEAKAWHIEKYDDQNAYDQAKKQFEDGSLVFEKAELAYREFLSRRAVVTDFDQEKRRLDLGLDETSTRVASLAEELKIKDRVVADLTLQLEGPDPIPRDIIRDVRQGLNVAAIATLEAQYTTLELALANLKSVRNPKDPEIVKKQDEINFVKEAINRLRDEARNAPLVKEKVDNPLYRDATDKRARESSELITVKAKLDQAREIHTAQSTRFRALIDLEPEHEQLRTAMLSARTNRDNAQSIWDLAQRQRALGLGKFSSLKEIEPASFALEKEGPNRAKLLLGGFFVGLFFGLGIIVLRTLPDTVVRTRDDLEQIEGLAVIGVMPRLDGTNLRRHVALREQGW